MPDHANISIHVRDEVADAIRKLAADRGEPLSRVALTLVQEAIASPRDIAGDPGAPNLAAVSNEDLVDELTGRLLGAVPPADYEAATARADAAEGTLAALRSSLAELAR